MINSDFWNGRSVFVTGHTGFKGGWISLWLSEMGAKVYGYALQAEKKLSFFNSVGLRDRLEASTIGDIRDRSKLESSIAASQPSIVIHMAAQPLVLESYASPIETYMTNVIGTVNLLEAVRTVDSVQAVVNITTDKCYDNQGWVWPYREADRLGGHDPYSSSKACAEIVTAAYRDSFLSSVGIQVASVRAGNVIGGGDWASDRLIPDVFRAVESSRVLKVRSPGSVRPWQHVLEPLSGYLLLAEHLVCDGAEFSGAWNFGPEQRDAKTVAWILDYLCQRLPNAGWELDALSKLHEANVLRLDSTKSREYLNWRPRWDLETALDKTIEWYVGQRAAESTCKLSIEQIREYLSK